MHAKTGGKEGLLQLALSQESDFYGANFESKYQDTEKLWYMSAGATGGRVCGAVHFRLGRK